MCLFFLFVSLFFFNDTATTEIYTLSLHDALPILRGSPGGFSRSSRSATNTARTPAIDRKSTRLNSSHRCISYAVFCLKKKKKNTKPSTILIPHQTHADHYGNNRYTNSTSWTP